MQQRAGSLASWVSEVSPMSMGRTAWWVKQEQVYQQMESKRQMIEV